MRARLSVAARETLRSLGIRNFRLFFGGQLISMVGTWLTNVALSLFVLHLTGSAVAVGLLTACQFGPVLLLGPWAGLVADRSDKRRLLLICQSLAMAQSFALAALAGMDGTPLTALYGVAAVGGVIAAFDNPARRAFLTEMVPKSHEQNAVSLNMALMTTSRIIGPALAGLLVSTVGFAWCFLADGLSYIAVLASLRLLDVSKLRPAPALARAKGQLWAGLAYVRQSSPLRITLIMLAVNGVFAFNFTVVLSLFVTRSLDGSESDFTMLFSTTSVGALWGALRSARRPTVHLRDVVIHSMAFGVVMVGLAIVPSLAFAFPVGILLGAVSTLYMTSTGSIMQLYTEPAMRGRVLALQGMVFLGSTPIGGPILGLVIDQFGPRSGLVVGGVACLGAAGWGTVAGRRALNRDSQVRQDGLSDVPSPELVPA